jgi:hypothetical protein
MRASSAPIWRLVQRPFRRVVPHARMAALGRRHRSRLVLEGFIHIRLCAPRGRGRHLEELGEGEPRLAFGAHMRRREHKRRGRRVAGCGSTRSGGAARGRARAWRQVTRRGRAAEDGWEQWGSARAGQRDKARRRACCSLCTGTVAAQLLHTEHMERRRAGPAVMVGEPGGRIGVRVARAAENKRGRRPALH